DDSGIWERDLFTDFLETRTSKDGSDLGAQLTMLFQVLNQPRERRASTLDETVARFPYVNGRIFEESLSIPFFNAKMRNKLLNACAFNWSDISPAIFGSLFQAVKSPEARRKLGEHYTTETNIRKTIDPLFLDELNEQFDANIHDIRGLKSLRKKLGRIKFMDPACGSGNFIIVAYRELRALELKILIRLQELGDTSAIPTLYFEREDLAVQLDNMRGIEIEEWPARIAQTSLRLVDHQANMAMQLALGKAPETLPLDTVSVIHVGNALRMDWAEVTPPSNENDVVIAGNPPFIGARFMTTEQTAELKDIWGGKVGGLDYVTGWFKKASDYFAGSAGGRFAFVSTNSIAQGQPVAALFKPLFEAGWRIRFAHQTFPWVSEAPGGAAVHCVITGFDKRGGSQAELFSYQLGQSEPVVSVVPNINGYLIDSADIFVTSRSKPLSLSLQPVSFGSMPNDGGNFIVNTEQLKSVQSDPIASKYLRKYVGARELVQNIPRWCLWLKDLDPVDLQRSKILRDRIQAVRSLRLDSKRESTKKLAHTPNRFGEDRQPGHPYVCMPSVVSENRRYFTVAHLDADVIASNLVYTAEDSDGFLFGIASSSMFITWQKAIGGRLESRIRFSNTVVWNNLPLPEVSPELRAQIIETGKKVIEARKLHPERSLAEHYHPLAMDPLLIKAHDALDKVVDKAFGATKPLRSNEERQVILFKRYKELTTP
ncbi:MAG TPA: DNA methyltransferase, partial [Microbacteriaceae bacterium]|nr:DNA methyltransferase [Microbacteriaceae bacterium]